MTLPGPTIGMHLPCGAPYPDLGIKYDPLTGIFGMDFYVVMGRPGFRVARRKHATGRVGASHRVHKNDTMAWFRNRFDGAYLRRDSLLTHC